MKQYFETHPKIVGALGAFASLIIATIYYFLVPTEAGSATGVQWFILTYAHSLVWVCMAIASALFALQKFQIVRSAFMYSALALYILFIATLVVTKVFK